MTSNPDLMHIVERDRISVKSESLFRRVSSENTDSPFFSTVNSAVSSPRDTDNFIIDYLLPQSDDESIFLNPKLETLDAESTLFFTTSHPHSPIENTTPTTSPPVLSVQSVQSPSNTTLSSPPSPLRTTQK
ncbi:hypothetical protein K7432_014828, partial [Basidiobolus ranarum]